MLNQQKLTMFNKFKNLIQDLKVATGVLALFSALLISGIPGISPVFGSDFQSARTAALGGAGHAAPLLNDAIYLNPSYASFLPTYSVAANYTTFSGPQYVPGSDFYGRNYNVSILDGRAELFQAGAGYTVREDGAMLHFGASKSIIKTLGVGLGGKIFLGHDHVNTQDATFSTSFAANNWFQTVLVVDNLIESSAAKARGLYREFIVGTKINLQGKLMLYIDPHYIPDLPQGGTFGHEIGVEITTFQDLYLRIGNFRNANIPFEVQNGNGWGLGVGFVAPRMSFDYGLSRVIDPHAAVAHTFGATLYL